jgi:hypothetical protein
MTNTLARLQRLTDAEADDTVSRFLRLMNSDAILHHMGRNASVRMTKKPGFNRSAGKFRQFKKIVALARNLLYTLYG